MRLTRRRVCLTAGAAFLAGPVRAAEPAAVVEIRRFAFRPKQVTVRVGQAVEWINLDPAPHTATGTDHGWDTGEMAKGDRVAVTFDAPGTHEYHCAFHPNMKASVTVTD